MNWRDTGEVAKMKERRLLWLYIMIGIGILIMIIYSVGGFEFILKAIQGGAGAASNTVSAAVSTAAANASDVISQQIVI